MLSYTKKENGGSTRKNRATKHTKKSQDLQNVTVERYKAEEVRTENINFESVKNITLKVAVPLIFHDIPSLPKPFSETQLA